MDTMIDIDAASLIKVVFVIARDVIFSYQESALVKMDLTVLSF